MTRTVDVVDDYHGTRVADPYRWLEELASPEVLAWAAVQDSLTSTVLDSDPLRTRLLERMLALAEPWDRMDAAQPAARHDRVRFALAPLPGGGPGVLTVREGDTEPRVLVDPRDFGEAMAIARFDVSPDQRHVAYALSEAGSEWWQVRVRGVADGRDLPGVLEEMLWAEPVWTRDGAGFFHVRYRRPAPGEPVMFHSPAVLYHRLGTLQSADRVMHRTPDGTTTLALDARLTPDGRYLLISEGEGAHGTGIGWARTQRWLLDLGDPLAPDLAATPVPLTSDRESAYALVAQHDSLLYFLTDRDAPRRRLVAVDPRDPGAARWRDVIPQQADVLDRIHEVNGRWVAVYLRDVQHRVRVFERAGRLLRELEVPPLSRVVDVRAGPDAADVELLTTSFLQPPAVARHELATGDVHVMLENAAPFDTAAYEARQVWYTSKDGTRVPMYLLHRRGIARDGSQPTLLHGYGASGQLTLPEYLEPYIPWLELGGMLALPALRGGGEFGRGWYEAAILERKQTTFDDFIAAAEWLIAQGYTSPSHLAIRGGSNGGLLVAAVLAQRPELFAAAVAEVPMVDVLRYDRGRHRAQFGHAQDAAQFPFLLAYAPLQRIRQGTCYPATLITTALNDSRAPAWHAFKLAATLQSAQACARPVLLRVHQTGGHLGSRGPDAWLEDNAEIMTFLARQLGVTSVVQSFIPTAATRHDVALIGGRVMDPESGLDAVRNVGIRDGRIATITEESITGATTIDVRGLVIAPGFIDLHQHAHDSVALRAKVLDGVTAAFELELGVPDVDAWYDAHEGRALIHYGTTVGHAYARMHVLTGSATAMQLPTGEGTTRAASNDEIARMRERLDHGLRRGALGVGLAVEYTPGADVWEVLETFRAAAAYPGAAVYVHVRGTAEPHYWMETAELFLGAIVTGAPLHIVHANSSYGGAALRLFEMIEAARGRGLDVTTEAYPYTAAMTAIESAPFNDWQSWDDERFTRFVWPPTGERLTRESFGRYREQGGVVVIHGMTEERLRPILASPLAMIVSDGVLADGAAHPRIAGTYARVLGRYVRDEGVLTLMEALRRMTLMPAQRLEARAPEMRDRGRIRVGAHADITVFDPTSVIDRATYAEPLLPSAGIVHVIVAGSPVVRDGALIPGVLPGRAVRGTVGAPL